jgi:hypothetical protein
MCEWDNKATMELMARCIRKFDGGGLTMTAPASLVNVARSIVAFGERASTVETYAMSLSTDDDSAILDRLLREGDG